MVVVATEQSPGAKPRQRRNSLIDREEAHRIATIEIAAHSLGTGVRRLCDPAEIDGRLPVLYNGPDLESCWIAYAESPITGTRSSNIVLISRATGDVLYSGSAHEEG